MPKERLIDPKERTKEPVPMTPILWGIVGFSFGGVLGGVIGLGVSLLFHYPAMKKGFDVD